MRSTLAMFLEAVEIGWCTQLWLVLSHMCDQHTCVHMRFGVSFFVVHKIMFCCSQDNVFSYAYVVVGILVRVSFFDSHTLGIIHLDPPS